MLLCFVIVSWGGSLVVRGAAALSERAAARVPFLRARVYSLIPARRALVGVVGGALAVPVGLWVGWFGLKVWAELSQFGGFDLFQGGDTPHPLRLVGWGLLVLVPACVWVALVFDPAKGRKRCGACWYSLEGIGVPATCPECGTVAATERAMLRTRRSTIPLYFAAVIVLLAVGFDRGGVAMKSGWMTAVPTTVMIPLRNLLPDSMIRGTGGWGYQEGSLLSRGDRMWEWQKRWLLSGARGDVNSAKSVTEVNRAVLLISSIGSGFDGGSQGTAQDVASAKAMRERLLKMGFEAYAKGNAGGSAAEKSAALNMMMQLFYQASDDSALLDEYLDEAEVMLRSGSQMESWVGAMFLRACARDPRALALVEKVLEDPALTQVPAGMPLSNGTLFSGRSGREMILQVAVTWPFAEQVGTAMGWGSIDQAAIGLPERVAYQDRLYRSQFENGNATMRRQYLGLAGRSVTGKTERLLDAIPQMTDGEVEVFLTAAISQNYYYAPEPNEDDQPEVVALRKRVREAAWRAYVERPTVRGKLGEAISTYGRNLAVDVGLLKSSPEVLDAVRQELTSGDSARVEPAAKVIAMLFFVMDDGIAEWRGVLQKIVDDNPRAGAWRVAVDSAITMARELEERKRNEKEKVGESGKQNGPEGVVEVRTVGPK
jgi:hypothetical protein